MQPIFFNKIFKQSRVNKNFKKIILNSNILKLGKKLIFVSLSGGVVIFMVLT